MNLCLIKNWPRAIMFALHRFKMQFPTRLKVFHAILLTVMSLGVTATSTIARDFYYCPLHKREAPGGRCPVPNCPNNGGPTPGEIARQRRQNEAQALAAKGSDAWDRRDWESAISFYQQAADIYPEEPAYLDNVAKARGNQSRDAIEIPRSNALNAASAAWDKKDFPEALRLYLQAQALRNEPALETNIRNLLVMLPSKAAFAAWDKKDFPEALRLYLQAQALENSTGLELNIRNAREEIGRRFPNGVPPRYAGLTDRVLPVGPSDKVDALFKLRVEKAFSERRHFLGLEDMSDQSGFVFDQGRGSNPADLPYVLVPQGGLVEAVAVAKAALVLPRTASERADAPPVLVWSRKLDKITAQQDEAVARVNYELSIRKMHFQQGAKANSADRKNNEAALTAATVTTALAQGLAEAAGGSGAFDPPKKKKLEYKVISSKQSP